MVQRCKYTLLTWVARQNDPFNQNGTPGPNLTLLFAGDSSYVGKIDEVVILFRDAQDGIDRKKANDLETEIRKRSSELQIIKCPWKGRDPTDHSEILEFLRKEMPRLRGERPGKPLVVHISPGTPSMQTVWVLMAETGMIEPPVELAKSYRTGEREPGEPSAIRVEVGLETFFKVYQRNQLLKQPEYEAVDWDPRKFRSERLKRVYAEARRFAQAKVPLLLLGERGTGKTTLATWIRSFGRFRRPENDRHPPMVPCGQYAEQTMRAELFGYVKGAFTGADTDKLGLLAVADGDTLFLDEIGDITPELQRLLIKAVEEHTYSQLGSTKVLRSDFRLITATNRPFAELKERLDLDFLDRIGLLRIEMPPLRELREDLDWIWESVIAKAEIRAAVTLDPKDRRHLVSGVLEALWDHPLPGNLRDLFVVAYRAIAALGDIHEPMSKAEAVLYALEGLAAPATEGDAGPTECVLRGFLQKSRLAGLLADGRLITKEVLRDLQRYMAREIRQYARTSRQPLEDICDVKERTLRDWVQ